MNTDIDDWIGTAVERSFAAEPAPRDPREYAACGRRARRRRRAWGAAATLAGAAALATVVVGVVQPGGAPDHHAEPAGSAVTPIRVTAPLPVDPAQASKCAAGSLGPCGPRIGWDDLHPDDAGRLVRGGTDVEVTGHYEQVLAGYPHSAAFEVTRRGRTAWALLTSDGDLTATDLRFAPPDPTRTFDQWVRDSIAAGRWFSYDEALPR
jgi:hypothetical protein